MSPLMLAAHRGCSQCVRLLIDAKARLDATSTRGTTALHEACDASNEEVALLLIGAGCNPELKNLQGRSALDVLQKTASLQSAARKGLLPGFLSGGGRQRREAATRIQLLLRGQLPTSLELAGSGGQPAFYDTLRWTEKSHRYMPPQLREAVLLLLLHSRRCLPHHAGWLPPDVWGNVFRFMHRAWICPPAPSLRKMEPPRAAAGDVSLERKLEAELLMVQDSLRHLSLLVAGDASAEPIVSRSMQMLRDKEEALLARKEASEAPVRDG